jgi:hypothetical protein
MAKILIFTAKWPFSNNEIEYTVKKYSDVDAQTKELYRSLNTGTIILNDIPISIDNICEEQIEYINNIVELYKEKYKIFKENYKPCFIRYTSGNDVVDMIANTKTVEIPDRIHFKEWAYIKGFEYLQHFLDEHEKQNSKGIKVRKKYLIFLENN